VTGLKAEWVSSNTFWFVCLCRARIAWAAAVWLHREFLLWLLSLEWHYGNSRPGSCQLGFPATQSTSPCTLNYCIHSVLTLASCLIYSHALIEYINCFAVDRMWLRSFSRCYLPWNSSKKRCSFSLFSMKNAKIVQLLSPTLMLTLISRADWSDKSKWYCRTTHCGQINLVR